MTQKQNALVIAASASILAEVPLVAIPDTENKAQFKAGAETANKFLKLIGGMYSTALELYAHVASYENKEQAEAFIAGYAAQAVAIKAAAKGDQNEKIASQVADLESRMRRVARATFGWITKDAKGKQKIEKGWGKEKVLKILTEGKGNVKDRLAALPGQRNKTSADGNKGATPVQRRIEAGKDATPSMESLGAVLAVKGEAISKPKQVEHVLIAAIKTAPENMLDSLVKELYLRLMASKSEHHKELGISLRDHLQMEQVKPNRVRKPAAALVTPGK